MKWMTTVVAAAFVVASVAPALAAPGNSGNGGNNGNHSGQGGGGSQGQGGGNGGNGGNHGGGHGGGHGNGGNGGHGGGNHGGGGNGGHGGGGGYGGGGSTPSVSAPSVDAGSPGADGSGTWAGMTPATGDGKARERTVTDLKACTAADVPGRGLVDYDTKADGSFTYWGYEFATPDFVQCMKDKGYRLDTAGRNELTDFGQAESLVEVVQGGE